MNPYHGARIVLGFLALLLGGWSLPAGAHLTPNSELVLTIGDDGVSADIVVPQGEYAYATGNPVGRDPAAIAIARRYLSDHLRVTSYDGTAWSIAFEEVEFKQIAGPPDLHATARLVPPDGRSPRRFTIQWSALFGELPSHFALVVLAEKPDASKSDGRTVLGALRAGNTVLEVRRDDARPGAALLDAARLGVQHIIGGYDHLLFLLALLLPAPLAARAGRWAAPRRARDTALQLVRIVTAFTIGHSLTLVGATLGGWRLPAAPVEVLIAVSVLVTAIHAIRPLMPNREHYVALAFGLVHGLAFATLLGNAGAGTASTAANLLGFNLGIEVVQLAIVAAVVPPLVIVAHARWFGFLRIALGGLTLAVSLAWIANRALGVGTGVVEEIDAVASHGLWALAGFYALAGYQIATRAAWRPQAG
ncbi:HupE/UreJ family protein [Tsuneonella sp. YG55]|uniref:HupE/UreJ family protein n=1 Tax=Tsuneonella litorea TaxID=2976475 RepID=A0A9X2VZ50_9SPHN|nr:HupE/UreJ family protein [Tsuneonella litorea]MCT2558050.1 HupE/UreJ family protein [Tsuneonella litorea]